MKKKKYAILGIVTVLLIVAAGTLAYQMWQDKKKPKTEYDGYADELQETNYITYKGEMLRDERKEGKKEGREDALHQIVMKMFSQGFDDEKIMEICEISREELESYKREQ